MSNLAVSGMPLKWCLRNCYNTCGLSETLINFTVCVSFCRVYFQCSGPCDNAWERRRVQCRTHDGQPSNECRTEDRPLDARRCDVVCEEETMVEGEVNVWACSQLISAHAHDKTNKTTYAPSAKTQISLGFLMRTAKICLKLFNFASDLFSRYSRGRYYRENKSLRKFNTSIIANGTS